MSKYLFPLCLAMALPALLARCRDATGAEGVGTNYVSIETPVGGQPMLVVRYPWTLHKSPSVEVRTYVDGEEESARIRPLLFTNRYMKDTVTITIYQTQAASEATRTIAGFERGDITFEAVGERNLLNRPAVCVTCLTEVLKPNREAFREKARWAIYPFMEPWAADDQTLFFSLPEVTFSDPAKIRVFFLRDDDLVWSETKSWPGLKKGNEPAAKPGAKPAAEPGSAGAGQGGQPASGDASIGPAPGEKPAVPANPFGP
ncbi:MAG: hypothetical protein ACYC6Y_31270 [Thermoguttaceae bacterium]